MIVYRLHRGGPRHGGLHPHGAVWGPLESTRRTDAVCCFLPIAGLSRGPRTFGQEPVSNRLRLVEGRLGSWRRFLAQNPKDVGQTQSAGRAWINEKRQFAIRVPSAVIPEDHNILLNPTHSGYAALEWQEPRPFEFDVRLFYFDEQADSVR